MLFDVVVTDPNAVSPRVVRNGVAKKLAKKLVKELRQKGFKAQFVTCKGKAEESRVEIPEDETEE